MFPAIMLTHGWKVFRSFLQKIGHYYHYYYQWNSQHLQGRSVVEDLVDHHPLQVAVHPGDALHGTRTSDQNMKDVRLKLDISHLTNGLVSAGDEGRLDPPEF